MDFQKLLKISKFPKNFTIRKYALFHNKSNQGFEFSQGTINIFWNIHTYLFYELAWYLPAGHFWPRCTIFTQKYRGILQASLEVNFLLFQHHIHFIEFHRRTINACWKSFLNPISCTDWLPVDMVLPVYPLLSRYFICSWTIVKFCRLPSKSTFFILSGHLQSVHIANWLV